MGALRAHLRPYAPAYRIIRRYYRWGVRLYRAATDPRDRARLLLFWLCLLRRDLVRGVTGRAWPEDRAITLYGAHFVVDLAPTEIFTSEEIYRDRCYDACPDFIARPGWTVVDIGANVDMFSQTWRAGLRIRAESALCASPAGYAGPESTGRTRDVRPGGHRRARGAGRAGPRPRHDHDGTRPCNASLSGYADVSARMSSIAPAPRFLQVYLALAQGQGAIERARVGAHTPEERRSASPSCGV